MKILLVITKSEIGGAQNFVADLAGELKKKHEVCVAVGNKGYLYDLVKKNGVSVLQIKHLNRTSNPLRNVLFIFEIKKYLDKNTFDIVHFNSSNALFGSIGAKLSKPKPKTVFTYHGLSVLDKNYQANIFVKLAYKIFFKTMMRFIDKSIYVCKQNKSISSEEKIDTKGEVIYNGIKMPRFLDKPVAKKEVEKMAGKNFSDTFLIGSIGRLSYQKNYEFLLNIFSDIQKEIPRACLVIVGDGNSRNKYNRIIEVKNLQQRVFLVGSRQKAFELLPAFDLFCLPSRYEGASITIIEALLAKAPLLVSRVGGNPELIPQNNIQTYELDSKKEFMQKLKTIYSDQNMRNRLSEENKQFGEQFSVQKMAGEYNKVYNRLTQS